MEQSELHSVSNDIEMLSNEEDIRSKTETTNDKPSNTNVKLDYFLSNINYIVSYFERKNIQEKLYFTSALIRQLTVCMSDISWHFV